MLRLPAAAEIATDDRANNHADDNHNNSDEETNSDRNRSLNRFAIDLDKLTTDSVGLIVRHPLQCEDLEIRRAGGRDESFACLATRDMQER